MFNLPLIADVWPWLVGVVFFVIYLLNHLLSAKNGAAKQREAQQRRRMAQAERPPRPQGQPQQGGKSQLNAEIEQFLKRANERRLEKARRAQPVRSTGPARPNPQPTPEAEEVLEVVPLEPHDFDSVAASVQQHLGGRSFEQRAEHLADDITQTDEQRARHFKQVFDHRLGNLDTGLVDPNAPTDVTGPPVTREDPNAMAKAMAGLLANHQNLRQAIVLKEILERPVDRW